MSKMRVRNGSKSAGTLKNSRKNKIYRNVFVRRYFSADPQSSQRWIVFQGALHARSFTITHGVMASPTFIADAQSMNCGAKESSVEARGQLHVEPAPDAMLVSDVAYYAPCAFDSVSGNFVIQGTDFIVNGCDFLLLHPNGKATYCWKIRPEGAPDIDNG